MTGLEWFFVILLLLVALAIFIGVPIWYFFFRTKSCSNNSNCSVDEVCSNGKCVHRSCSSAAGVANQCPVGYSCQNNRCVAQTCSTTANCTGGLVCINGRCGSCTADTHCATGQKCISGECITKCSTTTDCPSGFTCTNGICQPPVTCTATSDCPTGQTCTNGICQPTANLGIAGLWNNTVNGAVQGNIDRFNLVTTINGQQYVFDTTTMTLVPYGSVLYNNIFSYHPQDFLYSNGTKWTMTSSGQLIPITIDTSVTDVLTMRSVNGGYVLYSSYGTASVGQQDMYGRYTISFTRQCITEPLVFTMSR